MYAAPHGIIELNLRDGYAVDTAEARLAHALAISLDDWSEGLTLARMVRNEAFAKFSGATGRELALSVIGLLDRSRSRLPV
mgnify:CR=1 FL=1